MIIIKNDKHTIVRKKGNFNFIYNKYTIYEYCKIIEQKEEVKNSSFKKEILNLYAIDN